MIISSAVTFQEFVSNLLRVLDESGSFRTLRADMQTIISRYDDCVRVCEIAFMKKRSKEDGTTRHKEGKIKENQRLMELYSRHIYNISIVPIFKTVLLFIYVIIMFMPCECYLYDFISFHIFFFGLFPEDIS